MYPEYDGKGYEEDIHKYTFPHRKVYDAELWGTDYKDQFF